MRLLLMLVFSVVFHELGHIGVARALGWRVRGLFLSLRYAAVGVRLQPGNPADLWKIALGGLYANFLLLFAGILALPSTLGAMAVIFNGLMLLLNGLPFRIGRLSSDGHQILEHWRRK